MLDFSLIGILTGIAEILAENGISIFAISTYNTDMELANSRWRDGASQEEVASVAGMGVTRFKSLFKQATAGTPGNRNPSDAAARHTLLALSHQPFPSGTTRYKNSALTW